MQYVDTDWGSQLPKDTQHAPRGVKCTIYGAVSTFVSTLERKHLHKTGADASWPPPGPDFNPVQRELHTEEETCVSDPRSWKYAESQRGQPSLHKDWKKYNTSFRFLSLWCQAHMPWGPQPWRTERVQLQVSQPETKRNLLVCDKEREEMKVPALAQIKQI